MHENRLSVTITVKVKVKVRVKVRVINVNVNVFVNNPAYLPITTFVLPDTVAVLPRPAPNTSSRMSTPTTFL